MFVSVLLTVLSVGIFYGACLLAAFEGGKSFIALIAGAFVLLLFVTLTAKKKGFKVLRKVSMALLMFMGIFIITTFIPGFSIMPVNVISGVAKTFEVVTGKSPYAWKKDRNDILIQLIRDLKTPETLDFTSYVTEKDWDQVCFKASSDYSTMEFKLLTEVSYKVDYPKSKADFSKLDTQCFAKNDSKFREETPGSALIIH